jgi:hypothetical protein
MRGIRVRHWAGRWILGSILLAGLVGADRVIAQTPTRTLQVLVRTPTGQGVPGLMITLVPQPAQLGGPGGEPPPSVQGITDHNGQATFLGLRAGMWRVQLAGIVAGVPVQPVAEQARPPYGRVTAGGGFPLPVALGDAQEEGGADAGPPPAGAVQQALFVGQPRGGVWVPELDLGDPASSPLPISALPTPRPQAAPAVLTGVPTLDVRATAAPVPAAGEGAPPEVHGAAAGTVPPAPPAGSSQPAAPFPVVLSPLSLCYALPILVGLLVLLVSLLRRRVSAPPAVPAGRDPRPTIAGGTSERKADRHV